MPPGPLAGKSSASGGAGKVASRCARICARGGRRRSGSPHFTADVVMPPLQGAEGRR
jgi:hypothetical protein